MIILFLPGAAGTLPVLEALRADLAAATAPAEPAPEAVHGIPFHLDERNLIYAGSLALAASFVKLRPGLGGNQETIDLAASINAVAQAIGRERDIPATALCSALEAIKVAVDTVPTSGAASTPSAELEHVRRSLAMLTGDHGEAGAVSRVALVNDDTVRVLMPTGSTWDVELDRMPNPSALLKFVQDLTGKRWVTRDIVHQFVATVCEAKGWEIYNFAGELNQDVR